jgi:hypothetical protein
MKRQIARVSVSVPLRRPLQSRVFSQKANSVKILSSEIWIVPVAIFDKWRLPPWTVYQNQFLDLCTLRLQTHGLSHGIASNFATLWSGILSMVCWPENWITHQIEYCFALKVEWIQWVVATYIFLFRWTNLKLLILSRKLLNNVRKENIFLIAQICPGWEGYHEYERKTVSRLHQFYSHNVFCVLFPPFCLGGRRTERRKASAPQRALQNVIETRVEWAGKMGLAGGLQRRGC